jgi:hypothetical protein
MARSQWGPLTVAFPRLIADGRSILDPLANESREPMTRVQFGAARKRLKATLDQIVTMDKRDLERLIAEVIWLKKRLHRVEDAVEPPPPRFGDCDRAIALASFQASVKVASREDPH